MTAQPLRVIVTQSATRIADATVIARSTATCASPTLTVTTTENANVTKTGKERTVPSGTVSVMTSVKNVTALRLVTALSASAMPFVIQLAPVNVYHNGQEKTAVSLIKLIAVLSVAVTQIGYAKDQKTVTAPNALFTLMLTHTTRTVNVMMAGATKTAKPTPETAPYYAPPALDQAKVIAMIA